MSEQKYFKLNKRSSREFIDAIDRYIKFKQDSNDLFTNEGFDQSGVCHNSLGHVVGVFFKKSKLPIPDSILLRLAHIDDQDSDYVVAKIRRCKENKTLLKKMDELNSNAPDLQKMLAKVVGIKNTLYASNGGICMATFGWVVDRPAETLYITTKYPEPLKNCRPISNLLYNKIYKANKHTQVK